jgi:hypothetical protein
MSYPSKLFAVAVFATAITLSSQSAMACYDGTPGSTIVRQGDPCATKDTPPTPAPDRAPPTRTAAPSIKEPPTKPYEAVTPTRENIAAMVGRHFWWEEGALSLVDLRACPRLTACWSEGHIDYVSGTGFSVIGVANNAIGSLVEVDAHVRLDDGRTGYIALDTFGKSVGPWFTKSPQVRAQARAQWAAEYMARAVAACQRRPSVSIGMTQQEISASKWGERGVSRVNTTETAGHTREQWVYDRGPECNEDDTPGVGAGRSGYLYFDDGRLVAIQR